MATILCVDDEASVGVLLEHALQGMGHDAVLAASVAEAMKHVERDSCDLIISDYNMPGGTGLDLLKELEAGEHQIPVIIMTGYASVEHAVLSIRHGAFDYLTKPLRTESLRIAVHQALEVVRLRRENESFRRELNSLRGRRAIIGESDALRRALEVVTTVAPTRATVLLEGESGTGKELFARAIHEQSPRSDKPFVTLNCAAMPEGLVESALFGHEKGAFTGATGRQPGAFERAHQGTLLLDEISEMRLDLQAKLLRVLQEQEFERVGGTQPIRVDVRIIATTNRQLETEVAEGRFREDLFYRLTVVPIQTPPLRERLDDIPLLVHHFAQRAAAQSGIDEPVLEPAALELLTAYRWPGNVRELAHAVERAVILGGARGRLGPEDFGRRIMKGARADDGDGAGSATPSPPSQLPLNLGELEKLAIDRALAETGGHRRRAAELLGISERTLRNKLNK